MRLSSISMAFSASLLAVGFASMAQAQDASPAEPAEPGTRTDRGNQADNPSPRLSDASLVQLFPNLGLGVFHGESSKRVEDIRVFEDAAGNLIVQPVTSGRTDAGAFITWDYIIGDAYPSSFWLRNWGLFFGAGVGSDFDFAENSMYGGGLSYRPRDSVYRLNLGVMIRPNARVLDRSLVTVSESGAFVVRPEFVDAVNADNDRLEVRRADVNYAFILSRKF